MFHILQCLVGYNRSLNEANKITLYKLYIRLIMTIVYVTYCHIHIWDDISQTLVKIHSSAKNCIPTKGDGESNPRDKTYAQRI